MEPGNKKPEFIFETSWEVCNKVGGIHTVISTKAQAQQAATGAQIIYLGPESIGAAEDRAEFTEDRSLYPEWVKRARAEGLQIRVGRWEIPSRPVAVLIDHTPLIQRKDQIFTELWETYRLDSISGSWDFIEPALFGYAAGQAIESFCRFNLSPRLAVVAHFHEWMTAAGVLYLERYAPHVSTLFTTHATMVGRCVSSNNQPLYKEMGRYTGDIKAHEFNVTAKHSLEKSAAQACDCFATVSDITALECAQFLEKKVDVITPNGFDDSFVPPAGQYGTRRAAARRRLLDIGRALTGREFGPETLIVATSGRYEFRNKGLDLYLDAVSRLRGALPAGRQALALALVPANHGAPRPDLLRALEQPTGQALPAPYVTHHLHDPGNDPITRAAQAAGLDTPGDVSVVFVPCYLDGRDGIVDLTYYDTLVGADATVFASYYEPWGYTPLESIAFRIPTVTTSLSGFGQWVKPMSTGIEGGVAVVERDEENNGQAAAEIADALARYAAMGDQERDIARSRCAALARQALWADFIKHYQQAYQISLTHNTNRESQREQTMPRVEPPAGGGGNSLSNEPRWKKMRIQTNIPEPINGLVELSTNVWWSWNYEASQLFKMVDRDIWYATKKNPIALLNNISQERLTELERDPAFLAHYQKVTRMYTDYMSRPAQAEPSIAYFSMEYGLNDNINIYSGGLGILAGDYLKEASDSRVNLTAVGLLYKKGYFTQQLTLAGEQISVLKDQNLNQIPIKPVMDPDGNLLLVDVFFPGRAVKLRAWEIAVGRIKLYLLDSDVDDNTPSDRAITHQLYGGDWENRLKQEIILGVGSVRLLDKLGVECQVYHLNEGHAAFTNLERMAMLVERRGLDFDQALEVARHSSLFTTHTPVPAGHDSFSEELMRIYVRYLPERLKISWERFMNLGRWTRGKADEKFSMSVLAANTCQEVNGVSMLHGKVSREMFQQLYKGYFPEELHITHVTNGVHYATWAAKEWRALYEQAFGQGFIDDNANPARWEKIHQVDDAQIWHTRQVLRRKLIEYVKERYRRNWIERNENPKRMRQALDGIRPDTLTIGFARRFATYKRANLLFNDLERLSRLVNDPQRPVQFIFAGKAHPNDKPGQDLIKQIVEISRRPEFIGKIIFLENYDIQLAKRLVKGVDIWLNTPTRPLEASGTSGQKATLNGVLNCSVLDGWYLEGYREGAGWCLTDKRTYTNQAHQNELDSLELYGLFENQIVPMFYDRGPDGMPRAWIQTIKNSIAQIAPHYVTRRMMSDYMRQYYAPLAARHAQVAADDYAKARRLAAWKRSVLAGWDNIEVISVDFPDTTKADFKLGNSYRGEVVLNLRGIRPEEVGIEAVITQPDTAGGRQVEAIAQLELTKNISSMSFYSAALELTSPGMYEYALRIYPKNPELTYKMDFNLVRWL